MTNEFKRQFAIRMPDGRLYEEPAAPAEVEDYGVSSPMRDMQQMYSMLGLTPRRIAPTPKPGPLIFDRREPADAKLDELRKAAARMGVDHYGAAVVERLCTPFTSGDPSAEFAAEVADWIAQQGGAE